MAAASSSSTSAENRGPITTIFTPPSTCLATTTLLTDTYLLNHWLSGDPNCYPSATEAESIWYSNWGAYYYSPAVCPSGWTTMTSLSTISAGPSLGDGTSGYLCCPTGFNQYGGYGHACEKVLKSGAVITAVALTITGDSFAPEATFKTTVMSPITVYGDGIPIVWETTDVAILKLINSTQLIPASLMTSTTSSPSSSSHTASPTSSSSVPSNTTTGTVNAAGSHGLSGGGKAGIAIGVILIVAFAALGFFIWHQRRQHSKLKRALQGGLAINSVPPGTDGYGMENRTRDMMRAGMGASDGGVEGGVFEYYAPGAPATGLRQEYYAPGPARMGTGLEDKDIVPAPIRRTPDPEAVRIWDDWIARTAPRVPPGEIIQHQTPTGSQRSVPPWADTGGIDPNSPAPENHRHSRITDVGTEVLLSPLELHHVQDAQLERAQSTTGATSGPILDGPSATPASPPISISSAPMSFSPPNNKTSSPSAGLQDVPSIKRKPISQAPQIPAIQESPLPDFTIPTSPDELFIPPPIPSSSLAAAPASPALSEHSGGDSDLYSANSDAGDEATPARVIALRERMERIREERERLEKIQELKELEEQAHMELLDMQRRSTAS